MVAKLHTAYYWPATCN